MKNPWGLVIAVSAFLIQFITFGISFSFGIYIVELQKEYDTSLSLISSIGSINTGFQFLTGEFYLYASSLTMYMYSHICVVIQDSFLEKKVKTSDIQVRIL